MKKILFIGIGFYEYDNKILEKMKENAEVTYYSEEIKYNYFEKGLKKLIRKDIFKLKKVQNIENKILKKIYENNYDEILIIKSENLTANFYKKIKSINKHIILKLYLWDDIQRLNNFNNIKSYFNKIYTFDLKDSRDYNLEFLPLFYIDEFSENIPTIKQNDIYFSGWNHSDRIQVLKKILKELKILKTLEKKLYIYIGKKEYLLEKFFFKNELSEYFNIKKMDMQKNIKNTKNSKILVDIHHPTQDGLTMRTIEALGAKCKLITTNKNVIKYDFYNPDNILIINRETPEISTKFLETAYVNLSEQIYNKYSLTSWIKKVLE